MSAEQGTGAPQVLTMTEQVGYQEGAVVSKTVIDKKVGTLTLFAFAAGQGLSEHTAPYDAFIQVIEGEALITISGIDWTVGTGQMIIMPANQPHALKGLQRFKMLLVMIRA